MSGTHSLSGAGWSMWRTVMVRGAGFPARELYALAAPDAASALDRLLDREEALARATATAIAAIDATLVGTTDRGEGRALARRRRRLVAGEFAGEPTLADVLEARDRARAEALEVFGLECARTRRSLRELARQPMFREAVLWQNPHALRKGIEALLRAPEDSAPARIRLLERLVASYAQRYCAKNDSIGFFGPFGWGTVGDALVVRPGRELLARRTVYFEYWGIYTLAERLAQDPALRPHLAPRRLPTVTVEGTVVRYPVDRMVELPLEYARVLASCDGERSARSLARELLADPTLELDGESAVFEVLDELVAQKLALWTLEIPPHLEHPERRLVELLEAVEDREAARPGLEAVAELEVARDAVARAAGDVEALDRALVALDEAFVRRCETDATRNAGQTYAGRTLVYEDCRRDLELELPASIIDRFSAPLSLLLGSARWFTYTLAQRYATLFHNIHAELARETGSSEVDFLRFWARASDHFTSSDRVASPIVATVAREHERRWHRILGVEGREGERHIAVSSADLAPLVAHELAAPCPGWPSARHHSPDLLLAATDVDALARGDLTVVCGELHMSIATVATPVAVRQHPDVASIAAVFARERPPVVEAVVSRERAARADAFSILDHDLDLELASARSPLPRDRVLTSGSLVVVPGSEGVLDVRTRDGRASYSIWQVLDAYLSGASSTHFHVLPPAPHRPRVSIDGMVVQRESWHFAGEELAFAHEPEAFDRMLAARRWARRHGLPRFVFCRVPHEVKPCYVDFASPQYIESMAHMVRKATHVSISEMLPTLGQSWLPDAAGRQYTCELRMTVVDPEPWRPV